EGRWPAAGAGAMSGEAASATLDRTHQTSMPPAISIQNVSKQFGAGRQAVYALENVSLQVQPGELVCIVGASGCGKSTLLNLVAGLDTPTAGSIEVESHGTALMFQEAALFPWLTVEENVEFPLR